MTLSEAADILLDISPLVDEFYDSQFTESRRAIVMRQLSAQAGFCRSSAERKRIILSPCPGVAEPTRLRSVTFSQHFAAGVWLKANISDCLRQCERIADDTEASE